MILRRIGNKQAIAESIIKYFPPHEIYIEPFFGAGGMYFSKSRSKYNFLNDLDENVFNTFKILLKNKKELYDFIESVPFCMRTFAFFKKEYLPKNDIEKAGIFLIISNYSFMAKGTTFNNGLQNPKEILLQNIEKTYKILIKNENNFTNVDFRSLESKIALRDRESEVLIYCDPPYLGTESNYKTPKWKIKDTEDLLNLCAESKCNYAISEFDNPFIVEKVRNLGLNVIIIGERQNLGNRRTEILITNYKPFIGLFD